MLTIIEELDRERKDRYILNISAEDGGLPKQAAYQILNIFVEDVNDHKPSFETSLYYGSVQEGKPVGTDVARVNATDSDKGKKNKTIIIQQFYKS